MNGVCWRSDNGQQSQLAYFSTKRVSCRDGSGERDSRQFEHKWPSKYKRKQ